MWPAILILFTFFLFFLPLLPSLLELTFVTDVKPLRIIQEYDTEITYFATGFKRYLEKNFSSFFSAHDTSGTPIQEGTLEDATHFQIVHDGKHPLFNKKEIHRSHTSKLIIAESPLELPGEMLFAKEIYSASSVVTGENSQFRAILAEKNITLGQGCTILRWMHSATSLTIGKGCSLYGRISAENSIFISEDCQFERIHAPRILFGHSMQDDPGEPEAKALAKLETIPNVNDHYGNRWLAEGDIHIPALRSFEGDLIATKNTSIGNGTHIKGSLKSNKDLTLGKNVHVSGAVVSVGDIHIAEYCRIAGPIIAEGKIFIQSGCIIGLENAPTTISASAIVILTGTTVYGTVWAEGCAQVLAGAPV